MVPQILKSESRREFVVTVAVTAVLILCYALFRTAGHWIIVQMYNGALPFESINRIIAGQALHPVDHYIECANRIFSTWFTRSLEILPALIFIRYHAGTFLKQDEGDSHFPSPALILSLVVFAWSNRFVQDDAFISFRYAENLVNGHGLTWNPGEAHVEGYTNFLWTLMTAIPIAFGRDPIFFSYVVGISCFACTLIFTYRLAMLLFGSSRIATSAVVVLGTNYTFSAYATGGLETQLQAALLTLVALMIVTAQRSEYPSTLYLPAVSVLSSAAVLTRPDSLLPVFVLYSALSAHLVASGTALSVKVRRATALLLPGLLIGISYGLWKFAYYGSLIPNTYYAKVSHVSSAVRGAKYVLTFFDGYGLLPFIVLAAIRIRRLMIRTAWALPLMILLALWIWYVVIIGGCFMEFRFMVAVLPLMVILIVGALSETFLPKTQTALVIGLVVMSFFHRATFTGIDEIESIRSLNGVVAERRWADVGKALGNMFRGQEPEVTIATTAAGAIPYYSKLRTIDMFGLSDPWISRHGSIIGTRPGHQRFPDGYYLLDRGVNLVIGHPTLCRLSQESQTLGNSDAGTDTPGKEVTSKTPRTLAFPIDREWAVQAIYLVPNPTVERAIIQFNVRTYYPDQEEKPPDKDTGEE